MGSATAEQQRILRESSLGGLVGALLVDDAESDMDGNSDEAMTRAGATTGSPRIEQSI